MANRKLVLRGIQVNQRQRANLSPAQRLQLSALKNQQSVLSLPYWTTVRVRFDRSGVGPYTYTMRTQEVVGFSYAIGDADPAAAGFAGAGISMSLSETNLQSKHETIAGEELHIRGIAAQPAAGSDGRLLAAVWRHCALVLSLNGGANRVPLGPLGLIPGGGGLTGATADTFGTQPIPGGRPQFNFATNGWPVRKNLMPVPEGFVWRNKARRDGQLALILTPPSGRTVTVTTDIADEASAAGIRGYNYPGSSAAFVDIVLWLEGQARSARSRLL